jgi:hypothetical protein
MPSKMPTEGTERLCLHPLNRLSRLMRGTCGGNAMANNISREDPTGPTEINHQVTHPSKKYRELQLSNKSYGYHHLPAEKRSRATDIQD